MPHCISKICPTSLSILKPEGDSLFLRGSEEKAHLICVEKGTEHSSPTSSAYALTFKYRIKVEPLLFCAANTIPEQYQNPKHP